MTGSGGSDRSRDAVEVGAVLGAWGIQGWLKVKPYAAEPQALITGRTWTVEASDRPGASPGQALRHQLTIISAREHGDVIVAQAREVTDRNGAEALKGARIFISRDSFPAPGPDEFYWVDLIGLQVVNRAGESLGTVIGLIDTGPHCVLRVAREADTEPGDERLIPFVSAYVDNVSLGARRIVVDWGLDY